MKTRLVAYDALGAQRGVLPNPLEVSVTSGHNDLGVVSIHYDQASPKHEYLDNEPEIAVQTFINNAWVEIRNTRAKCLTVDFDHLEEVPTRRYDFIGVGEGLKGALVYGAYGQALNDDGKVQFTTSNPGRILSTIWDNAVTRGWSGFNYSFSPTVDSAGVPWNKTFSISYAVETNLLAILNQLVAQGTCDYDWDGRTLNVYNANTYLARDLSLGSAPVRFFGTGAATGTDSAPEKQDVGQLATHVVVLGEEGLRWEFPTGTIVPEGRREVILTFAGVDDIATAQILAAPTILKSQNHLKNTTRQFHITTDTTEYPFTDYRPGDWAYVQRGTEFEKMRIASVNIQVNANGTQGYVVLGDKIDDLLEIMYSRIQGLTGGIANEGAGPIKRPPRRKPSAPYGVNATPSAVIAADGTTQGLMGVNWSHNGKDTQGESIDIRDYIVYYREKVNGPWEQAFISTTQSGTYSPLEVYSALRVKLWYQVQIVARSSEGVESDPSAIVEFQTVEDTTAPFTPTLPVVSTWLRTVTVKWDTKGKSPTNVTVDMPADFSYVKIWQATTSNMVGKVLAATMDKNVPTWTNGPLASGTTYWYALSAVDWSGNESALTASVSITPTNNVDVKEIINKIDAATTEISNVGSSSILTGAVLESKLADNAVSQIKMQDQAVSLAKLDTTVNQKMQQGIDDAFDAQTAADTANLAAGNAQTAADLAKQQVAAFIASGISLTANGDFEAPIVSPPTGWPTRSLTYVEASSGVARSGTNVLRASPSAASAYAYTDYAATSIDRTYTVEYWVRLREPLIPGNEALLMGAYFSTIKSDGTSSVYTVYGPRLDTLSTTVWTRCVFTYKMSVDSVKTRFGPRFPGSATPNSFEIDDFKAVDLTDRVDALAAAAAAQLKANDAFDDAADALLAAGNAQLAANGKNNVYYMATLPSGTGFVYGDTVFIRSAEGQPYTAQYRWDTPSLTWKSQLIGHQVMASVDLGKATVGELDGVYIKAQTLKATHLLVGSDENLIPNGSGEKGTIAGWPPAMTWDTADKPTGLPGSFRSPASSGTQASTNLLFDVKPGEEYLTEFWMKADKPDSRIFIELRDQAGAHASLNTQLKVDLTTPSITTGSYLASSALVPTVWTKFTVITTMNATTTKAKIGAIYFNHTNGTERTATVWLAGFTMRPRTGNVLIKDGAVYGDKVAVNGLTAKQILIGDFQNVAIGSDFEDSTAVPWTLNTLHVISTLQAQSGTQSLKLSPAAAGNYFSTLIADTRVKPGEEWYFKFWVYLEATFNGTAASKMRIANAANGGATNLKDVPYNAVTKGSWQQVESSLVIPAGVTSLNVRIYSDQTTGIAWIDNIEIRRKSEASLIRNLNVEQLTVGTGLMDSATIAELWTKVVRSQKISTDMMNVGRGVNPIVDPFFEDAALKTLRHGISGSWGAWGRSTPLNLNFYGGTLTAGTARSFYFDTTSSYDPTAYIPVEEGQKWRLSLIYTSTVSGPRATIRAVKKDGTSSFTTVGWTKGATGTNVYEPAGSSLKLERIYTVPADVAYILPAPQFESTCTSAYVYGGATFTNMTTSSLIVDGAVTAASLTVTDTMWANIIKFKQLTGAEIDVNSLTSDTGWIGTLRGGVLINDVVDTGHLKALAITSKHTITGATFQTEVTALRGVKISTALGLMQYDASGNIMVRIGSGSSNLIVGDLQTSRTGMPGIKLINSSAWGLPAIQYSYEGNVGVEQAASFMRYTVSGDPELVHRAPNRSIVGGTGLGFVRVEGDLILSLGSGNTQKMRVEQPFNIDAWSPIDGYHQMTVNAKIMNLNSTNGNIVLDSASQYVQAPSVYSKPTGVGGNVYIAADGGLFRSTSASKYKIDPVVMAVPETLLDVPMKNWIDLHSAAEYSEYLEKPRPFTFEESSRFDAISLDRIPGALAEDVEAAGGKAFVTYGADGQVEGLMYDRFALARTSILHEKLLEFESRLEALEVPKEM